MVFPDVDNTLIIRKVSLRLNSFDEPFISKSSENDLMPDSGVLFIGDVGQDLYEEVDLAHNGGENFGWPIVEGPVPVTSVLRIQ